MGLFKLFGMMFLVPTTMMLTVSFFVLFAVRKAEDKGLKTFGWVIAILLWICAALAFSTGMYISMSGHRMMSRMGCPMCQMMMGKMSPQMMKGHMMGPGEKMAPMNSKNGMCSPKKR